MTSGGIGGIGIGNIVIVIKLLINVAANEAYETVIKF
jgi:hypothetical protein